MTKVLIDHSLVERTIDTLEELYLHTSSHEADESFYVAITELRAALEQPQKKQELLTEEAIQKLIVPGDYLTLGGLVKFARSVEQAVSGHTGPQQREVRFAELEIALKNRQHQHKPSRDNDLQLENGHLITSSSTAPAGWRLVPVGPTQEMAEAGKNAHHEAENKIHEPHAWDAGGFASRAVRAAHVYRAMLAAAPQPPALDQPQSNPTAQDISDSALLGNIESPFNACMHQEHCKRWKERSGAVVEQKLRPGMVYALPPGDYVGVILRGRYYPLTTPQPPVVEQPQIDWHDMYLKERRRAEMWIAKYEQDIGKLEVAVPVAAQPPSVAARTCANCLHNKPPFGNCDGCSQQNDDADDEGNWEPIPEPQGEQGTAAMAKVVGMDEYGPMLLWNRAWTDFPVGTKLYTRPHPRQPLTDEQIDTLEWSVPQPGEDGAYLAQRRNVRAIERAHKIGTENE